MTDDIVERIDKWAKGDDVEWQDELLRDAKAEIERLRAERDELFSTNGELAIDLTKLQREIEQLRAAVATQGTPAFVPHRPVWLDVNGLPDADWHQQRLLSVTQGTLELARQAMQVRNEEFVNHLYARAISEINQVIASGEPKP